MTVVFALRIFGSDRSGQFFSYPKTVSRTVHIFIIMWNSITDQKGKTRHEY